jgi:antitoxin component of MazEF toxin-antitoxin module
MRKRTIKKYGNTWVIKLESSDVKDFGLVEGDMVDIDDLNLLECKNNGRE